jgi:hypothetical protein
MFACQNRGVRGAKDSVLRIVRLDGSELLLDAAGLTEAFFRGEPASTDDALAGYGAPDRIDADDLVALNRMRARSPHGHWRELSGASLPWLRAIPVGLDLIEADDDWWAAVRGDELVRAAIGATVGPGRGVAVATKLLHLKRPRLFPMLDALVAQLLGQPVTAESVEGRTEQATRLVLHLRAEGRRNAAALTAAQERLAESGHRHSLIRILDAALWLAHPAAGSPGSRRRFTVELL